MPSKRLTRTQHVPPAQGGDVVFHIHQYHPNVDPMGWGHYTDEDEMNHAAIHRGPYGGRAGNPPHVHTRTSDVPFETHLTGTAADWDNA